MKSYSSSTRLETAASGVSGVKSVAVNLDNKVTKVTYDVNKTNLAAIEGTIEEAGYADNDKPADPAAYEKLSACCKVH